MEVYRGGKIVSQTEWVQWQSPSYLKESNGDHLFCDNWRRDIDPCWQSVAFPCADNGN